MLPFALLLAVAKAETPGPATDASPPTDRPGAQCAMANELHLPTEDGASIALHHHACAGGPPVLMVHGISSNARFFDLDAHHSLATWLAERGWDVWMLDLRGHGEARVDGDGRRQVSGWTVDDYGRYDASAAIAYIRRVTGWDTVAYVGHSMGGMVGGIYLATHPDPHIASFTTLASPAAFSRGDPLMKLAQTGMAAGGGLLLSVESPMFGVAAAQHLVPVGLQQLLYNPANFTPDTIDAMLRNIVSPMSRREMQHFARMLHDERFESFDRKTDWFAALHDVTVPTLAVASSGDHIVPAARARAWADALGGEVEVVEADTAGGMAADYGHLDYTLGERASTEIFPRIEAWLSAHPPRRADAAIRSAAPTRATPAPRPP